MRILRRIGVGERGFALVIALGILVVLSIVVTTLIDYTASNSHHASRSKGSAAAYSLAEAGLNDSESILNSSKPDGSSRALDVTSLTGAVACPDGTTRCIELDLAGGKALYFGAFSASSSTWTITSWGDVRNPTGVGITDVRRKIVAVVHVVADPSQPANTAAWNYVYATNTSNSTTCDVDVVNSVTIDYSMYVAGNLCLENSAVIEKNVATVDVNVQGRIGLMSPGANGNHIGKSGTNVDYVRTPFGCMDGNNPLTHTPPHACSSGTDFVYTNTYDTNPPAVSSPLSTTYWTNYWTTAAPGPKNACTTSTGTPPTWGSGSAPNLNTNGAQGTFELTAASSYTCVVKDGAGITVGQLSWDATSKVLTVSGVVYCDCSMTVSNGATNVYNGYGTIYLTGTFQMSIANTRLCGVKTSGGGDCDFSGTFGSPNQSEMLVIAANGNDGSGNSINILNGGEFQGGLLGIHNINFGNSSQVQGGVVAPTEILGNSVVVKPLPIVQNLPLGAPGNPTTHASVESPAVTGGG